MLNTGHYGEFWGRPLHTLSVPMFIIPNRNASFHQSSINSSKLTKKSHTLTEREYKLLFRAAWSYLQGITDFTGPHTTMSIRTGRTDYRTVLCVCLSLASFVSQLANRYERKYSQQSLTFTKIVSVFGGCGCKETNHHINKITNIHIRCIMLCCTIPHTIV